MFTIFKFLIAFTISFLILSIPIGNKHLFGIIHSVASPYTKPLYDTTLDLSKEGFYRSFNFAQSLFTNSNKIRSEGKQYDQNRIDEVQSSAAAPPRERSSVNKKEIESLIKNHHEAITAEEEEMLRRVLMESL